MIAIILAAGKSERFGSNKLLEPLIDKPIIQHVVDQVSLIAAKVFLVTGYYHHELYEHFKDSHVKIFFNPDHAFGQYTSANMALELAKRQGEDLLITLGDLPFVTRKEYQRLVDSGDVCFARHSGVIGPPAFIPLAELASVFLQDNEKLKYKFKGCKTLDIMSAAYDIDTPQEKIAFSNYLSF